jgi:hypothetical protein|nr:MAG TPA: acetyltransferase domain containing protein [Caudoviricetes sp.]
MILTKDIRKVTEKDYTNTNFLSWLYKLDEFNSDEQDTIFNLFRTGMIYGYFVNDIMRGFIRVCYNDLSDVYSVNMLFVDGSFHNCGIGSTLLQLAIDKFEHKDMVLNVFTDNNIAIHLYKNFGFVIEGIVDCSNEPECPIEFKYRKQYRMRRRCDK